MFHLVYLLFRNLNLFKYSHKIKLILILALNTSLIAHLANWIVSVYLKLQLQRAVKPLQNLLARSIVKLILPLSCLIKTHLL